MVAIVTSEFRLVQNNLFVKNERRKTPAGKTVGNDKYGIEMAWPKSGGLPQELVAACRAAMTEAGVTDADAQRQHLAARFKDGDKLLDKIAAEKREKYALAYKGMWLVRATSKFPLAESQSIGAQDGRIFNEADADKIAAGDYGRAAVTVKFLSEPQPGLVIYLNGFLLTRKGAKLPVGNPGGGRGFASLFAGVTGGVSAHAPADALEDDVPF